MTARHPNSYRYLVVDGTARRVMTMDVRRRRNPVTGMIPANWISHKKKRQLAAARDMECSIIVRVKK